MNKLLSKLDWTEIYFDICAGARLAKAKGQTYLATERRERADVVWDHVEGLLTDTEAFNADCDCANRDADEIPVYLKAEEIRIVCMAMANITFGMVEDDMDVVTVHKAIREVFAYLPDDS
jgi:hypothetical protein